MRKKNFGQYKFSAYCSYLGTKDHGISKIKNEDGVIHILSCSNVAAGKTGFFDPKILTFDS